MADAEDQFFDASETPAPALDALDPHDPELGSFLSRLEASGAFTRAKDQLDGMLADPQAHEWLVAVLDPDVVRSMVQLQEFFWTTRDSGSWASSPVAHKQRLWPPPERAGAGGKGSGTGQKTASQPGGALTVAGVPEEDLQALLDAHRAVLEYLSDLYLDTLECLFVCERSFSIGHATSRQDPPLVRPSLLPQFCEPQQWCATVHWALFRQHAASRPGCRSEPLPSSPLAVPMRRRFSVSGPVLRGSRGTGSTQAVGEGLVEGRRVGPACCRAVPAVVCGSLK